MDQQQQQHVSRMNDFYYEPVTFDVESDKEAIMNFVGAPIFERTEQYFRSLVNDVIVREIVQVVDGSIKQSWDITIPFFDESDHQKMYHRVRCVSKMELDQLLSRFASVSSLGKMECITKLHVQRNRIKDGSGWIDVCSEINNGADDKFYYTLIQYFDNNNIKGSSKLNVFDPNKRLLFNFLTKRPQWIESESHLTIKRQSSISKPVMKRFLSESKMNPHPLEIIH